MELYRAEPICACAWLIRTHNTRPADAIRRRNDGLRDRHATLAIYVPFRAARELYVFHERNVQPKYVS